MPDPDPVGSTDDRWLAVERELAALQGCDALLDELGSANNWSNIDLWLGGGLITSAIKHDHMDTTIDLSRSVDQSFATFRRELGDVHMESATEAANLSTGTRFVDTC